MIIKVNVIIITLVLVWKTPTQMPCRVAGLQSAGADQTFLFNADMDPDPIPAPHQSDTNLRPLLVYTVQTL